MKLHEGNLELLVSLSAFFGFFDVFWSVFGNVFEKLLNFYIVSVDFIAENMYMTST